MAGVGGVHWGGLAQKSACREMAGTVTGCIYQPPGDGYRHGRLHREPLC